jgi:hypothetical protein
VKQDLVVFATLTALLLVVAIGCPQIRPAPVAPADASDATAPTDGAFDDDAPATIDASISCATACERLRSLGCKEGKLVDCADVVCRMNADTHFRHYNLMCITRATTIGSVRACGGECTP